MASQKVESATRRGARAFSPSDFEATLRPLREAATLPPYCYSSQEFYELEVERIFMREWLCVGRTEELPNPCDYFTLDIAGEPIVIARDETGVVRAFSRVCRHRGALAVDGEGNRKSFSCPFHGWTYSLRGELIGAPLMEEMKNFDKSQCSLPALKVEEWEGFVFVNFDQEAKPLAPRLKPVSERFKNYRMSEKGTTKPMVFYNQSNWKYPIENGVDTYHARTLHPELFVGEEGLYDMESGTSEDDPDGLYAMSFSPTPKPYPWVTGTNLLESVFPPLEGLTDFERQSFNILLIYPVSLIFFQPDGLLYLLAFPQTIDRTMIRINHMWKPGVEEHPDFARQLQWTQQGFIDTNDQDMFGCRMAQRGISSRLAKPGRFAPLEQTTWFFNRYVIRRMLGEEFVRSRS